MLFSDHCHLFSVLSTDSLPRKPLASKRVNQSIAFPQTMSAPIHRLNFFLKGEGQSPACILDPVIRVNLWDESASVHFETWPELAQISRTWSDPLKSTRVQFYDLNCFSKAHDLTSDFLVSVYHPFWRCSLTSVRPAQSRPLVVWRRFQLFWNLHSRLESFVPDILDHSIWIGAPSKTFWMHNDRDDQRITSITESRKVITRPCSRFPGLLFGEYLGQVNIPFEYIL
jgi:hypothetical protein